MPKQDFRTRIRHLYDWLRPVFLSWYVLVVAATLILMTVGLYLIVDRSVMPAYTRHDFAIQVPDVYGMSFEEAAEVLETEELEVQRVPIQYVDSLPRDVVVGQDPPARSSVKPGRHIYLRVNSGEAPMVQVPTLFDLSLRQAKSSLLAARLTVGAVLRDTMPSPYRNTITRQDPAPGDSLIVGSAVDLWISSGLGASTTRVPEVVGLRVASAESLLRVNRLQYVLFDVADAVDSLAGTVLRIIPPARTELQEGSEVRLFVAPDTVAVDSLGADSLERSPDLLDEVDG